MQMNIKRKKKCCEAIGTTKEGATICTPFYIHFHWKEETRWWSINSPNETNSQKAYKQHSPVKSKERKDTRYLPVYVGAQVHFPSSQ